MRSLEDKATYGFVICVENPGYPASLERGRTYRVVPDDTIGAEEIRVVDESGEDYLYPAEFFSPLAKSFTAAWPPESDLYSDIEREARRFVEENEPLLDEGSVTVLQRVYVHGADIVTVLSKEAVEAANHAESVIRQLTRSIKKRQTPAVIIQKLERKRSDALKIHEHRSKVFEAYAEFLDRVHSIIERIEVGDADAADNPAVQDAEKIIHEAWHRMKEVSPS